jgi:hypothetical protein
MSIPQKYFIMYSGKWKIIIRNYIIEKFWFFEDVAIFYVISKIKGKQNTLLSKNISNTMQIILITNQV